ncbi:MAG: hypothetical protein KBA61_08540 [Spirochaetes bacterium]|nr:hypothetical protein [Spirochaetota bacterium]
MELSPGEKLLKNTAFVYAALFIGAVAVFIFAPGPLLSVINALSSAFFPSLPPAGDSGKFWLSMTVSMMATIIALSLFIYRDVRRYYMMALPLVVAKFTSSFFGLAFFLAGIVNPQFTTHTLANLVIFISDFPLGLFLLLVWKRVHVIRQGL